MPTGLSTQTHNIRSPTIPPTATVEERQIIDQTNAPAEQPLTQNTAIDPPARTPQLLNYTHHVHSSLET